MRYAKVRQRLPCVDFGSLCTYYNSAYIPLIELTAEHAAVYKAVKKSACNMRRKVIQTRNQMLCALEVEKQTRAAVKMMDFQPRRINESNL